MKNRPPHAQGTHREPRPASTEELEHEDEILDEGLEESDPPPAVQPGHAQPTGEDRGQEMNTLETIQSIASAGGGRRDMLNAGCKLYIGDCNPFPLSTGVAITLSTRTDC